MVKKKAILIIVLSILVRLSINASLIHTIQNGNWENTSTWIGGALPGISDDVQIDNTDEITLLTGNSYTVNDLWMDNVSTLNINGNLTINNFYVNNVATLNVSGTLTIQGNVNISNNGGLTINSSGTLNVSGSLTASTGASLSVYGDVNIAGDVTFSGSGDIYIDNDGVLTIDGNLAAGSATISGTGPIYVAGTVTGTNASDSQINAPLPIELISFDVRADNNIVVVTWQTASEINNDLFTIERSSDGISFEEINYISGSGNSNVLQSYIFTDYYPIDGISYYRLKQTDFDGTTEIFKTLSINPSANNYLIKLKIYPNPATGYDQITIKAEGFEEGEDVLIIIMSNSGSVTTQINSQANYLGDVNEIIEGSGLRNGMYVIWIRGNTKVINSKLIIN